MYNDLTKELLKFLSLIYEEIPHEISSEDLKINFKKKQYDKLLSFSKNHKYIEIISRNISLTKIGKEKLFELRSYFSDKRNNVTKIISIISIIVAFLALMITATPNSPKIYWQQGNDCPEHLAPQGIFQLNLNNYGTVPSSIEIFGEGNGINIRRYYYENKTSIKYHNSFALPPTQISGGYKGLFTITAMNISQKNVSFNMKYTYTSYFLGFIPIPNYAKKGKQFNCCYIKDEDSIERYSRVKCEHGF